MKSKDNIVVEAHRLRLKDIRLISTYNKEDQFEVPPISVYVKFHRHQISRRQRQRQFVEGRRMNKLMHKLGINDA